LFSRIATRLGIACNNINGVMREGIDGKMSMKYSMSLVAATAPEEFFVRSDHRERFVQESRKDRFAWRVATISDTTEMTQVYCPYVPETGAFALDGFILTGNSNPYQR